MDHQYWLFRTKPQKDEIFSSWLVRLAYGLAWKLQPFCTRLLGQRSGFWIADVDKAQPADLLGLLADRTATPLERVGETMLASYEGILWGSFHRRGPLPWVMPVGRTGRRRFGNGQQFCRQCLIDDEKPYFRKHWRLACFVACEQHGLALHDKCPHCFSPIEFHAYDFGRQLLSSECPITRCGTCGHDFRERGRRPDFDVSSDLWEFQARIYDAVSAGYSATLPGGVAYSHLFFEGLRMLARLVTSNSRGARLRNLMLANGGHLPFPTAFSNKRYLFDELGVDGRLQLMELLRMLLEDWPHRFVRLCRDSRVSSSYILNYKQAPQPFWLESSVRWSLYDKYYAPTERERASVRAFLRKHQLSTTQNNVNRWLGVASQRGIDDPFAPSGGRWNPRIWSKRVPDDT